jgi:hypothetical protein
MLKLMTVALVALSLTVGGTACGTLAGDCSGAAPDGAGNCIPSDHGPQAAQQAAFKHYGDQAEQVVCFNHGPFRFRGEHYHSYGCKAIRGGHLQNDETYCVILHQRVALTEGDVAALPSSTRACD